LIHRLLFLLIAVAVFSPIANAAPRNQEFLIVHPPGGRPSLSDLIEQAIGQGFYSIRIEEGSWELTRPISISGFDGSVWIHGDPVSRPPELECRSVPCFNVSRSSGIIIENLDLDGGIDLDQTEDITIKSVIFHDNGIHLKGRRCNQPNECTSYNRNIHIQDSVFENCDRGVWAERLESSLIEKNRFVGDKPGSCERIATGIELDGTGEDIDRRLEYGHNKANRIIGNFFDQDFATGIRIRNSLANIIRENEFHHSFRALEFFENSRHNQILSNYVAYLSPISSTSACPAPCGIYVGPGTFNNVFLNNFFEQNFEIQFLERNRNKNFVIDESGGRNVFRTDYQTLR